MVKTGGNFFCEITSTQHFSNDIVPISFEMPDFLKKDMVRAFYIAKFYDLYEAVQTIIDKGQIPTVAYLSTPENIEHLPGMIIACDPKTRHIITGDADEKALSQLEAFSQVPTGTHITFSRTRPHELSKENIIVVCQGKSIPKGLIFSNTNMVLINPGFPLHLVVPVRKYIFNKGIIPDFLLSIAGYFPGMSNVIKQYGLKNISRAVFKKISGLKYNR